MADTRGRCSVKEQGAQRKMNTLAKNMESVPEGANLGLVSDNPAALPSHKPGETVVVPDSVRFNSFLALDRVGDAGRGIGVDMTPGVVAKAGMVIITLFQDMIFSPLSLHLIFRFLLEQNGLSSISQNPGGSGEFCGRQR